MTNRIVEVVRRGRRGQDGYSGLVLTQTKTSGHTATASERGYAFRCTASLTMAFEGASTLTSGWHCIVYADGGDVTLDPDGSETINGSATLSLLDGYSAFVFTDGTNLFAFIGANAIVDFSGVTDNAETIENALSVITTAGTAAAFTITSEDPVTTLAAPKNWLVKFHANNSASATMAVDGLVAVTLKKYNSAGTLVDLAVNDVRLGEVKRVAVVGANLVVIDPVIASDSKPGLTLLSSNTDFTQDTGMTANRGAIKTMVDAALPEIYRSSSAESFSAGNTEQWAHELSGEPDFVSVILECTTAEGNYSIGDRIYLGNLSNGTASSDIIHTIKVDDTNISFQWDSSTLAAVANDSGGATFTLTPANWDVYVKAVYFP